MAETPIEQFCEDLLRDKNLKNNVSGGKKGFSDKKIGIKQMRNNINHEIDNNNNNYNDNNDNNDNDNIINGRINRNGTNDEEYSRGKNVPQNVSVPSWIRTVFLVALNYAKTTAILLIIIFLIFAIIRLILLPDTRRSWVRIIIEPIVSILFCLFPLSFSLPIYLLFVEAATTSGFLATSEVILRGDNNNENNFKNSGQMSNSYKNNKKDQNEFENKNSKNNNNDDDNEKENEWDGAEVEVEVEVGEANHVSNPMNIAQRKNVPLNQDKKNENDGENTNEMNNEKKNENKNEIEEDEIISNPLSSGELKKKHSISEDAKSGSTRMGKSTNNTSTKQFVDEEGLRCKVRLCLH